MTEDMGTADRTLSLEEPRGRWVLAVTVLGSGLAMIDATVVNIALPAIGSDLGGGVVGLTWTVNAYTLTLASLILLGGSLGDRFGRRRVFLVGVVWFAAGSLLCALAPNIALLVVARGLQGVGGALLTPGSLAILQASFRREDRSRAIGAWSGLGGVAGALGPFLGGWLVDVGSWRWIFLVNVPVAVAVVLIAARHVPESRDEGASQRTDGAGAGAIVLGLGGLTYGLTVAADDGLSSTALVALVVGLVGLSAFVVREHSAAEPMLPLDVFGSATFTATNVVTFLVYAALGGLFFWLVVTLQVVAGFGPLRAGLALLPLTLVMLAFSASAGALSDRIGPRVPMTVGPLVAALGVAWLTRVGPESTYLLDVLAPVTVVGVGLTALVTPLTATALGAAPDSRAGVASGVNNAVARTAALLAIAVLPLVSGLDSISDADAVESAYRTVMWVCAGLLVSGGVVSAGFVRRPVVLEQRCPRRHCAVDGPPLVATPR